MLVAALVLSVSFSFPGQAHASTETFSSTGFAAWTAPAGVTSAIVACWGGGGAGFLGTTSGGGSGGGGGAFASSTVVVTPGTKYTLYIGEGGATSGANGATSTFATTTVVAAPGWGGKSFTTGFGLGGAVASSTGTTTAAGGRGGNGANGGGDSDIGGGGGGAGGPHGAGGAGATASTAIGGGGGGGNGGNAGAVPTGGTSTNGGAGGLGGNAANGQEGFSSINGGGGGGGSDNGGFGGAGGTYGGGGGGGEGAFGAGGDGACTITYDASPSVTTSAATSATTNSATITGNISGVVTATTRGFATSTSATLSSGVSTTSESGSYESGGGPWTAQSAAGNNDVWYGFTYGNGLYVAVGDTGDRVMTSPNGVNWTAQSAAGNNDSWYDVTYGDGLYVAVGVLGDLVMTSPDGTNWTAQSAAGNNDQWWGVTYGEGLYVAVGISGDRVMTSPDGTNWTPQTAAGNNDSWTAVTYGNGLFVAVSGSGDPVMTSPDGTNWTPQSAAGNNDAWRAVTYGDGLFVAVGNSGDKVMTSPNGTDWTIRSAVGDNDNWYGITYGNGLYVAVGDTGDRVMTSTDGISWTTRSAAGDNDSWNGIKYANSLFVAVGTNGDRVMTSPDGSFTATSTGLSANSTYYARAFATNSIGTGYGDIESYLTLPATPGTPTFSATYATSTLVSWTAPSGGATSYKLERCQNGTGTCSLFTGLSGLSTTSYGLSNGISYDFAVRATNATGDGAWSATSTVLAENPGAAPTVTTSAPSSLVATSTTANGNITDTGGANATARGFATSTNATLSSSVSTSSVSGDFGAGAFTGTQTGLSGNTTYYVRAYATNPTGTRYGSIEQFLTPPNIPGTPTYSGTTATSTAISWTGSVGSSTSYKVEQCVTGSATCSLFSGHGTTSTTTINLTGNTSYDYAVRGTNTTGDGLWSATSTVLTVPGVPTSIVFSGITSSALTLSWNGPTGSSTSYKVERCAGSGCSDFASLATGVGTTTYSDSGLTPAATYRYRVRGTNATGDGLYSAAAEQALSAISPTVTTSAASSITATGATTNGNISDTGGENATVRGFASSTSATMSSGVSTSTENGSFGTGLFTSSMSNLTGNTTYYTRAYASNSAGTGYGSIESLLTLPGTSGTPSYSAIVATSTLVSWTAPTGGAASYKLEQCLNGTGTCALFSSLAGLSTTTYSLAGNTDYDYAVRATNATGDGAWSATTTVRTVPEFPGTPTYSNVSYTTLTLEWTAPTGGASTYKVERCAGGGCTNFAQIVGGVAGLSHNDTDLSPATEYRYRVRATNSSGDGLYSTVSATTTLVALAPTVATDAASGVVATSSVVNGTITDAGSVNSTVRGFASSTDSTLVSGVATSTESGSFGAGAFTGSMGGLTGNTTYYVRAYATNVGGTAYGSTQFFLTHPGIPGTPSFTSISHSTLTVNWAGSSGSSTSYKLERCTGSSCTDFAEIATGILTTTYNDSGLTFQTDYRYRVRGTNATGDGLYSAIGSVTTIFDGITRGGGHGGGGPIGGDSPPGQGNVGGGGGGGGDSIGNDPNFFAPSSSAAAWGGGWTNPANAYAEDDSYTTTNASAASDYGFGFSIPSGNTIAGIAVKILASGSFAAGSIGAELSWNSGTATTTSAFTTGALTTDDVLYTLGGATELWGRSWVPAEFADFRLRLTGMPSSNTLYIDAIQVRVYHNAGGGGGGGGGEI